MAQTTQGAGAAARAEEATLGPDSLAESGTKTAGSAAFTAFKKLCVWAPAIAALALLAFAVRGGMPVSHVLRATLTVLLTQVLPGTLAWRAVRPRRGWLLEDLAIGFAIGSVLAIGAQVAAGSAEQPWISFSPLLVAVVLLAVPGTRTRITSARTEALPWWWGPPVAALFLTSISQLITFFRLAPMTWASGARSTYVDMYLHLSLAAQLAHRGPTTFPWVQSEPLGYHWFSHAWIAQVSVTSGTGLEEILFRFMPVVMPVVVVLAIATAAVRLTGAAWTGPVAALLAVAGGDLNVFGRLSGGSPLAPLSPSLALAIPMLVGIVLVLALRWNGSMLSGGLVLLAVLCLGAAGTKGSTLPLVLAGLGLTVAALLIFDRTQVLRVLGDLAVVAGCLVFALIFVFLGSGAGLRLSISDAAEQTAAADWLGKPDTPLEIALVLTIAVVGLLARGVGGYVLPFSQAGRRSALTWLLIGGGLTSAGAVAFFTHPGWSQWYFVRTAEPLMAIGSVLGLVALFAVIPASKRVRIIVVGLVAGPVMVALGPSLLGRMAPGHPLRLLALVAIAVVVLAAAGFLGWRSGASRTERVRLAGAVMVITILSGGVAITTQSLVAPPGKPLKNVAMDHGLATSRGQIQAALWIRDHSGVNDLVMTNRHCTTPVEPVGCDSRRFVVAAFSERQVLVEGWTATPMSAKLGPNGRDSITISYWKPELLRLNDGFIAEPTAQAARELRERGVRWIYVDHTRPYANTLEPYATLRYQTSDVDVYEFTGSN